MHRASFILLFVFVTAFPGFTYAGNDPAVCMEGHSDGSSHCLVVDINQPPNSNAMAATDNQGYFNLVSTDGAGLFLNLPLKQKNCDGSDCENLTVKVSQWPFAPDGPKPTFWCMDPEHKSGNINFHYLFSAKDCTAKLFLANGQGSAFANNRYGWGSPDGPVNEPPQGISKVYTDKRAPTLKFNEQGRANLGISRPKLFNDSEAIMHGVVDKLYADGGTAIRMGMLDVVTTQDDLAPEFKNLLTIIEYINTRAQELNTTPLDVLIVIMPPSIYNAETEKTSNQAYIDRCAPGAKAPVQRIVKYSKIDTSPGGEYETRIDTAFAELKKYNNIVGFELGDELDSVCFNGDIAIPATDTSKEDMAAFTNNYAKMATIVAGKITAIENWQPLVISFGATKTFSRGEHYDQPSEFQYAVSDIRIMEHVFSSTFYGNYGDYSNHDPIDIIGQHIYPLMSTVGKDLKNLLYTDMQTLNQSTLLSNVTISGKKVTVGELTSNKNVWVTEWGFTKAELWPNPAYIPFERYRAMLEFMEHINSDGKQEGLYQMANKITNTFLFGYDFWNGAKGEDYRIYEWVDGKLVAELPTANVMPLYTRGVRLSDQ